MNTGVVTSRYARALLKYVQETGAGEKVYSQAAVLVHRMREYPQLAGAIQKHSDVTLQQKLEILESAVGEVLMVELKRFVTLVCQHRRMDLLHRMLYSYVEQYRSLNSIKVGRLVTACPAPGLKEKLQSILSEKTASHVSLEESIDPAILGGFILKIDDLLMDASVEYQFRRLRKELIENNKRIV